jgi:hypothetical protein
MIWRPGKPPTAEGYEIYDELCTSGGRVVAIPDGLLLQRGDASGQARAAKLRRHYDTTRDWAERITGLKVDRDLNGRGGRLKCRQPWGRATCYADFAFQSGRCGLG